MPARERPSAARLLLILAAAAISLASAVPASSTTTTTFEASSEGCAGGGDLCGTFPLVPSGDATYSHSASSNGTIDISASTEGGLPLDACLPVACPPGRYHAEALGSVWVDENVPAGASAIHVTAAYRLDELVAQAEATIGNPVAALAGTLSIAPHPGALCSDGSAVTGAVEQAIGTGSALGPQSEEATIVCAGATGTLPALLLHVGLSFVSSATSDGGTATAAARAQLLSVEISAGG
jgi:hypothetical protein